MDDDDINQQFRRQMADRARQHAADRPTVMEAQAARHGRRPRADTSGSLVATEQGWTLLGALLQEGQTVEVYTNKANGWLRGRVHVDGAQSPCMRVAMWNPWGPRDADGLPPRVASFDVPLVDAVCRWSAALQQDID